MFLHLKFIGPENISFQRQLTKLFWRLALGEAIISPQLVNIFTKNNANFGQKKYLNSWAIKGYMH